MRDSHNLLTLKLLLVVALLDLERRLVGLMSSLCHGRESRREGVVLDVAETVQLWVFYPGKSTSFI